MTAKDFLFQRIDEVFLSIHPPHIAVAVSGGADSMALCLALHEWCQQHQVSMTALTIDHTLRPESSKEAEQVHEWLTHKGIHHVTLTWNHDPILNNIQERAREARYQLLINYCIDHTIPYICTAHHQNDQWETFMMRLSHGSGLRGLAGIPIQHKHRDITILRPFLKVQPSVLKTYLREKGQSWIEDPSNQNTTFERIRWRQQAPALAPLGITPEVIEKVSEKLHQAAEAIEWAALEWMKHHTQWHKGLKFMRCDMSLNTLPETLTKRIMLEIASRVRATSITSSHVRHSMNASYERLCTLPFRPFTMGGCYWMYYKGQLIVVREWDKCPTETVISQPMTYDHRFKLSTLPIGVKIRPMGKELWSLFKHQFETPNIPYQAFLSLPIVEENTIFTWYEIDW